MGQAMLKPCPVCKKPAVEKYRPFCSARCANIDLGGWLGEKYRVPGEPAASTPNSDGEDFEGKDENAARKR